MGLTPLALLAQMPAELVGSRLSARCFPRLVVKAGMAVRPRARHFLKGQVPPASARDMGSASSLRVPVVAPLLSLRYLPTSQVWVADLRLEAASISEDSTIKVPEGLDQVRGLEGRVGLLADQEQLPRSKVAAVPRAW
ncbi:hypothetical protein [Pseudomonas sp. NPDC085632]|uniref:hypothetical protein n=1 Tax=Pseudomonas sp. NPDC085632 TaxID=3364429 RepID=UPI0037C75F00